MKTKILLQVIQTLTKNGGQPKICAKVIYKISLLKQLLILINLTRIHLKSQLQLIIIHLKKSFKVL